MATPQATPAADNVSAHEDNQRARRAQLLPAWTGTMGRAWNEVMTFLVRARRRAGSTGVPDAELARRTEQIRSFLWHLEFGHDVRISTLKGYPNRIDEALRLLSREDHRDRVPEDIAHWAAAIHAKFERDNWGQGNSRAGTTSHQNTLTTTSRPITENNNSNNARPRRSRFATVNNTTLPNRGPTPSHSPVSDHGDVPGPVAQPAAAPAIRLPPPDHPIWGTAGIMHGLYMTVRSTPPRTTYHFDPRYLAQKRDAKVLGHNGLAPGDWWPLQMAALYAGAHGSAIKGICGSPTVGAYSIVVSGSSAVYHSLDTDNGDILHYSADSPRTNLPSAPSADTRALQRSLATRGAVRVLRSAGRGAGAGTRVWAPEVGIRYDGLYRVVAQLHDTTATGHGYLKFRRRIQGQRPLAQIRDAVPSRQQKRDEARLRDGY
ncbi:hypothetical protein NEMBOFW57_009291 [Staphylotrichum longicolle]|uniref:YDG domain-containing protein n=1 Tax=Staphylotrichum longicolle TaxID=669026 RepID=A0AAD4ENU2_9PEZI|nr:hypothetical protein NEMBOFW57_009291 [Staphylotrichum longicolle]